MRQQAGLAVCLVLCGAVLRPSLQAGFCRALALQLPHTQHVSHAVRATLPFALAGHQQLFWQHAGHLLATT